MSLLDEILENKIIAIVRGAAAEQCSAVVDALYEGGIRFVEITYDQSKPESWPVTAATNGRLAEKRPRSWAWCRCPER